MVKDPVLDKVLNMVIAAEKMFKNTNDGNWNTSVAFFEIQSEDIFKYGQKAS